MPESYDLRVVNVLLSIEFTELTGDLLISQLMSEVKKLQSVIRSNIDPALSAIKINGYALRNFSPDVLEYNYNIYGASDEMPEVPVVTPVKRSQYAQQPMVDTAQAVPERLILMCFPV